MKIIRQNYGALIIAVLYLLSFLYMLPLRDQGFQDDWAYIQSVRHFDKTSIFKTSDWAAPSAITPLFWATLFAKIFGFSIKITHLSVVTLVFISSFFYYSLLKLLRVSEFRSTFFTLVLIFFPWVFQFTYSFLTEVPYLALSVIALYFYTKGVKQKNDFSFTLGSVFAAAAYLTRQIGLVLPIAAIITIIYQNYLTKKITPKKYALVLTPFLIAIFFYSQWLQKDQNLTVGQYQLNVALQKNWQYYL